MRRSLGVVSVLSLTLSASLAMAGSPEGHREAAVDLLRVMDLERSMMAGATTMIDLQVQQNPTLGPFRDVMLKWAGTFMTWDAVSGPLADLYVQTFTESELKEMTAFYRTPTGRKALTEMPGLMQKSAAMGAELAKVHTTELEQMIRDRAEEIQKATEKPDSGSDQ